MKKLFKKASAGWADDMAIGKVHLKGAMDVAACGLDYADYISVDTNKPITCSTCLTYFNWAKNVAIKVKS